MIITRRLTLKRAHPLFKLSFAILLHYRSVCQLALSKMVLRPSAGLSLTGLLLVAHVRAGKDGLGQIVYLPVITLRFRSPLLSESLLIHSRSATKMFQFAGFKRRNFSWAVGRFSRVLSKTKCILPVLVYIQPRTDYRASFYRVLLYKFCL